MEVNIEKVKEDPKIKNLGLGTVIYEKSSSGQVIANVIPKKRGARRPPIIQEMKHCPIDESNVENVLDRMSLVTESLQQILQNYKDDLKKTGGGFVPRPSELRPPILKKRLEIAEKLTATYDAYRQAVDDIAEMEIGGGEDKSPRLIYSPPRKPAPKWPKIEVKNKGNKAASIDKSAAKKQLPEQQMIRKSVHNNNNNSIDKHNPAASKLFKNQYNNNNSTIPFEKNPSIRKPTLVNSETPKDGENPVGENADEVLNVSNDLMMSCENCAGEDVYARAQFDDDDVIGDSDDVTGDSDDIELEGSNDSVDSDV